MRINEVVVYGSGIVLASSAIIGGMTYLCQLNSIHENVLKLYIQNRNRWYWHAFRTTAYMIGRFILYWLPEYLEDRGLVIFGERVSRTHVFVTLILLWQIFVLIMRF